MRLIGLEHSNSQTCASNASDQPRVLLIGNMSETRHFIKRHGSRLPKETHDGGSEPSHQGRLSSELQYLGATVLSRVNSTFPSTCSGATHALMNSTYLGEQ